MPASTTTMTPEETVEAMRASDLFSQILVRTLGLKIAAELSSERVSFAQVVALRYIWLHDHVLMGDLATGLGISYPSATNMVKRLEKNGLVTRKVNPADRREVEVRLTEEGFTLSDRMERTRVERLWSVLSAMTAADRASLISGLRAFVAAAVVEHPETAADVCLRCGERASDACPVAACTMSHANR